MGTIQQSNINFNNVPVGSDQFNGWGTKYTNMNNVLYGKYDPDPENIEKSFNAVEIDWNGAQLGTTIINTTGELLSH